MHNKLIEIYISVLCWIPCNHSLKTSFAKLPFKKSANSSKSIIKFSPCAALFNFTWEFQKYLYARDYVNKFYSLPLIYLPEYLFQPNYINTICYGSTESWTLWLILAWWHKDVSLIVQNGKYFNLHDCYIIYFLLLSNTILFFFIC